MRVRCLILLAALFGCESSARKIFFTGSVEVGRKVGEICAKQLKGSVLELGGKDPQIVCADADLANAVSGCIWGGFANAGQTCSAGSRLLVERQGRGLFVNRREIDTRCA